MIRTANVRPKTTNVKYSYDYPENRSVSEHIKADDKTYICFKTGFSLRYVNMWCKGQRKNRRIMEMAREIARINQAKAKKLQKLAINN